MPLSKNQPLSPDELSKFILDRYDGLIPQNTWGETSFFYNPNLTFTRGTYFITIKEKDGQNDKASDLDREDVYRLNFGVDKKTFLELFKHIPARPEKGGIIAGDYDFTKLDTLTPHPVYGWMSWLSILNPTKETLKEILPLIDIAYQITKKRFLQKKKI